MFIYQTSELVRDYLSYPVTMSIRVINQRNSLFPAITICNQNRLKRSKIEKSRFSSLFDIDHEIENILKASPGESDQKVFRKLHDRDPRSIAKHNPKSNVSLASVFQNSDNVDWATVLNEIDPSQLVRISDFLTATREEIYEYGHQFDELVVLCDFDHNACTKSDFYTFAHDVYGICHTFNHGLNPEIKPKTTSHIGAEYGLKLVLFIDQVRRPFYQKTILLSMHSSDIMLVRT